MGWAYCGHDRYGREIGYGIEATCDKRGCGKEINRGLGCVCGGMHNGDEGGCGRYFCDKHGGGWSAGPRGGCMHRGKLAWGKTRCQLLRRDGKSEPKRRPDGLYDWLPGAPVYYCACHEWTYDGPRLLVPKSDPLRAEDPVLLNYRLVPGFEKHIVERGFRSEMKGDVDIEALTPEAMLTT